MACPRNASESLARWSTSSFRNLRPQRPRRKKTDMPLPKLEHVARERRVQTKPGSVFLNFPYDTKFHRLFLAYIAGVVSLGLQPRVAPVKTSADNAPLSMPRRRRQTAARSLTGHPHQYHSRRQRNRIHSYFVSVGRYRSTPIAAQNAGSATSRARKVL